MTYIEFFDNEAIENILGLLILDPDRVVLVGSDGELMKKHIESYKKALAERGRDVEFIEETVSEHSVDGAEKRLTDIVKRYGSEDCVFDIGGGDEAIIFALGRVAASDIGKGLRVQRFSVSEGRVFDINGNSGMIPSGRLTLSVKEIVGIYGGTVSCAATAGRGDVQLLRDIDSVWELCRSRGRLWNTETSFFRILDSEGEKSDGGLTSKIAISRLDIKDKNSRDRIVKLVKTLQRRGLITRLEKSGGTLELRYKNNVVKSALLKAGRALELKIYADALRATDKSGKPVYNDAQNSVVIDWDGKKTAKLKEGLYDTANEIDVLLMKGASAVFISCKNGAVGSDELYKLCTVAERFGGRYSVKVLVAPSVNEPAHSAEPLRQRAKDMGVILIEDPDRCIDMLGKLI